MPPFQYLDFDLEIGPGQGRDYPVAVLSSPAGEARGTMHFPFDELTLENQLLKLQMALLRSGGRRRQALSPEQQAVQEFGQALFEALFSGEIRSRFDVSQERATRSERGLRLRLRIHSPELAALPWEYLFDARPREFLCLSRQTPVLRYPELTQPAPPLRVQRPLRILGVIADPSDLPRLNVDQEKERVAQALAPLQAGGDIALTWLAGSTVTDLQRALRRGPWHIFHFVGHGGFDRQADEGVVVLTDEQGRAKPLLATQLARLLGDERALRLVVLNACEGARSSQRDVFSSAAAILVRRGIPAVLAMQHEITDRAAIEFARAFYDALSDGLPVDAAVSEGRKAVSLQVANTVEWGTPVLTMRAPDGVLFEMGPAETKPAPADPPANAETVTQTPKPETLLTQLRQLLVERFSDDELRTLGFDLGVDYEGLPGAGKAAKARELVAYLERRMRLADLVRVAQQSRPDVAWPTISSRSSESRPGPIEIDWVEIPAGPFLMGSDKQKDKDAYDAELPQHTVTLAAYRIGRTPVTNVQYKLFADATGHEAPRHWLNGQIPKGKENHPVVNVSWHDAQAFCDWAKARLPTETEWEKAARGTDGRIYPWGNEAPDASRCNFNRNVGDTTPVGKYPKGKSPYGVLDLAGNVWEWTSTIWGKNFDKPDFAYPYDPNDGREDRDKTDVRRVLRGGSWFNEARNVRSAFRIGKDPAACNFDAGFRVTSPGL